jgi:hypothetical protein
VGLTAGETMPDLTDPVIFAQRGECGGDGLEERVGGHLDVLARDELRLL